MSGEPSTHGVTLLLHAWSGGDKEALDHLAPLEYRELRRIAGRIMTDERPNHTLQATALVNEAYVRLVETRQASGQDRAHFFAPRARAMRGGDQVFIELEEGLAAGEPPEANLMELDAALSRPSAIDPRKSQVVEMRFFGGLSLDETAAALKVSTKTVQRDWDLARGWLYHELLGKKQDG